jgi:regulator of protease activity HflC (stomatin/prohibitin superfamily)
MIRSFGAVVVLFLAALAGYEFFNWTVNRVYVPEGKSLMLRYKGGLIFRFGERPAKAESFAEEGEVGIRERLCGPGRHFYCPVWWERTIVDDIIVHTHEVAIVTSKLGENLSGGQYLVEGDVGKVRHKGILRRTLGPGRYRINPYGYDVKIVKTEEIDVGNKQIKRAGWVEIEPGYVGVVTYLTDSLDSVPPRHVGIQDDVLPPGLYPVNRWEKQIDVVSVGFNAKDISTTKQKDAQGNTLVDESGEEMPVPDTGISYPSSDGFKIHMDFTAIWGILPEQAPEMIRRFGNIEAVEQKIIQPQCESICRNFGSRRGAVDLLIGESRQQFQDEVDTNFTKVLKEKNLTLLYGLVRHIYIPKEVREPIQKGYIADELTLTREQETKTAKTEATLRESEQTVKLEAAKITEETKKLVANVAAKGQQTAEQTVAETEKQVAVIDRQAAQLDAQRVVTLGEAQANAQKMQQEAKAELFGLAVKAFGDAESYTRWQFAEGLPEDIDLKLIYAGEGTLWTDLRGVTPVLPLRSPPAKKP